MAEPIETFLDDSAIRISEGRATAPHIHVSGLPLITLHCDSARGRGSFDRLQLRPIRRGLTRNLGSRTVRCSHTRGDMVAESWAAAIYRVATFFVSAREAALKMAGWRSRVASLELASVCRSNCQRSSEYRTGPPLQLHPLLNDSMFMLTRLRPHRL